MIETIKTNLYLYKYVTYMFNIEIN